MKNILLLVLALSFTFGFCACAQQESPETSEIIAISLSETAIELAPGDSLSLTASFTPASAGTQLLTWQSANTNVATVINGTIYAIGDGTTDIFATAANGVFGKCSVTVKTPSAYSQLNSEEKAMFDDFIRNLSYFDNPSTIEFLGVKKHSWDNYDYKYLATITIKNAAGGIITKNVGFSGNGIGSFVSTLKVDQSDSCYDVRKINAALQEHFGK